MADRTLAGVGEVELVDRILAVLGSGEGVAGDTVRVGPGDDAAVLRCSGEVVVTTDAQHEGVHFERRWIEPRDLGARSIAVNASDLGAMGARPSGFLVALALPRSTDLDWVLQLAEGLRDGARAFGAEVIGGDIAAVEARVAINVTAIGDRAAERAAGRDRGRPGQRILVTGRPGRAAAGRALLQAGAEGVGAAARSCIDAFLRPQPPVALGIAAVERGLVGALMDVSDGIGIDLHRLCRASGVGARLDREQLLDDPRLAAVAREQRMDLEALVLGGGEDYELLCTVDEEHVATFHALSAELGVRVAMIGDVVDADEGLIVRGEDRNEPLPTGGWDHFACR